MKKIYIGVAAMLIASSGCMAVAATQSVPVSSSSGAAFATIDYTNYAGALTFAIGDHNGNGYMSGATIVTDRSSDGWNLPVGTRFCVHTSLYFFPASYADQLEVFSVVGPGHTYVHEYGSSYATNGYSGNSAVLKYIGSTRENYSNETWAKECETIPSSQLKNN